MAIETETKQRILDEAESLLQALGYNGFSYKHIAEKLGIRNAAIHYHFAAKSDLGEAVVRRFRERFAEWRDRHERKHAENAVRLLDGFIAIPRSYARRNGVVCPVGALEREFEVLPDGMRVQTRLLSEDMLAWLRDLLERGRAAGAFRFEGTAAEKALLVFAALQGASLMASAGEPRSFEVVVRQVRKELGVSA